MKAQPLQVKYNPKLLRLLERKQKAETLPVLEWRKWADEYNNVIRDIRAEYAAICPPFEDWAQPCVEGMARAQAAALDIVDKGMPAREDDPPGQAVADYLEVLERRPDLNLCIIDAEINLYNARLSHNRADITTAINRMCQAWTATARHYVSMGGGDTCRGFVVATDEECPA